MGAAEAAVYCAVRVGPAAFAETPSRTGSVGPVRAAKTQYSYKVIMTNKRCSAKSVMLFHHGSGGQEGIIGEVKESAIMDSVPTRN